LRSQFAEVKTRRGIQNVAAMITAIGALKDESADRINFTMRPEYQWLGPGDLIHAGGRSLRTLLLQEIGRFPDTESMREAARWVCEHKPTAKKGTAILREWRLTLTGRKAREYTETEVAENLLAAVNERLSQYPQTAWEAVAHGLELLCVVLRDYAQQVQEENAAGT